MRTTARAALQYRLRVIVAGLVVFFVGMALSNQPAGRESGLLLFRTLHGTIVVTILLIAPAMTADSISRERREGTLDLLFLTPLTGTTIVSSKLLSESLRMGTLWLASVPIGIVPVLVGGVSASSITCSVLVQLICIIIGLLSGMTVSIYSRRALPALLWSIVLCLGAVTLNFSLLLNLALPGGRTGNLTIDWLQSFGFILGAPSAPVIAGPVRLNLALAGNALWVIGIALLFVAVLGARLSLRRRRDGESPQAAWFRRVFLEAPAFLKEALRRSMQRKIEKNPLIWLEYRTTWSRSARLITVGMLVLAESYVLFVNSFSREFLALQALAGFALVLLIAITSSSSFQKEKESGALELLLVAPFNEETILRGRLQAVWSYYKPAGYVFAAFLLLTLQLGGNLYESGLRSGAHLISVCLSAITVPMAGLYFALRFRNFIQILASTCFFGILLPYFACDFLREIAWFAQYRLDIPFVSIITQLAQFGPSMVVLTVLIHGALMNFFSTRTALCLRTREFAI